jgi:Zn-dependent M28 family amino/carboxypeptidase
LPLGLALTVAALVAGCGGAGDGGSTSTLPFDTDRAMRDIEMLAQTIGPRAAGSEADATAATYIADQFAAARFGVIRNQFTFETDPNRPATVTAGGTAIEATTAGGSGAGSVTAPAAELPDSIQQGALTGKIAVTTRGSASFQQKYDTAWASGAAGLVIVNSDAGPLTANLGQKAAFPVVTVPGASLAQLQAATRAGESVGISVPVPQTAAGANIIARSSTAHTCAYIAVANFDSQPGSPGANDDASGVAVLLELARQYGGMAKVPEVCFVAMDARFAGGFGAEHYLDSLTSEGRPAVVIAAARVADGGRLTIYGETTLKAKAGEIAKSINLKLTDGGAAPPATTNTAVFRAAAISTLDLTRPGGKIGRDDTLSEIQTSLLKDAGQFLGELLLSVSATIAP